MIFKRSRILKIGRIFNMESIRWIEEILNEIDNEEEISRIIPVVNESSTMYSIPFIKL